MKRYRLLKDLPTFKAGDEFFICDFGSLMKIDRYLDDGIPCGSICAYGRSTLQQFPNILTDWFEEIPDEPTVEYLGQYIPADKGQAHDNIIIVNYHGEPDCIINCPMRHIKTMAKLGLSFKDENDCYKWLEKQEAYQTLVRDTKGFKVKNNSGYFWTVFWDVHEEELRLDYWDSGYGWARQHSDLNFATEADAEASIKAHPKEWKTYLGVEE